VNEAEVTTEELRELIRQGHGMVKDMHQAGKELRKIMGEAAEIIERAKNADYTETERVIAEVTDRSVKQIVEEVVATTEDATAFVSKTIYDRFDVLMGVIMGTDRKDGQSIPDLIIARHSAPKIDLAALENLNKPIERPER
jgi:hypothetical protein